MRIILAFAFSLLAISNSFAQRQMNIYEGCENNITCKGGCKKLSPVLKLNVNKAERLIQAVTYENGSVLVSRILEGCKIVDSKNFECIESKGRVKFEQRMLDGIYSEIWYSLQGDDDKNMSVNVSVRMCAK